MQWKFQSERFSVKNPEIHYIAYSIGSAEIADYVPKISLGKQEISCSITASFFWFSFENSDPGKRSRFVLDQADTSAR
jgi:beta-lactamase class D